MTTRTGLGASQGPELAKHWAVCNECGVITGESASGDPDERKPCPDRGSTSRLLTTDRW